MIQRKNNPYIVNAVILNGVCAIHSYFMITRCFSGVAPESKGASPGVLGRVVLRLSVMAKLLSDACLASPASPHLQTHRRPSSVPSSPAASLCSPAPTCPPAVPTCVSPPQRHHSLACVRSLAAVFVFRLKSLLTPVGLLRKIKERS